MCDCGFGMAHADLESFIRRTASVGEFADFAGTVSLHGREVRAGNAGVIDHAYLDGIGSEANILPILPCIDVSATDAEARVNAEHALLPRNTVHNARADADLFHVVIKGDSDELTDGAGLVHFSHVAQAFAVSGFGDFVAPVLEI